MALTINGIPFDGDPQTDWLDPTFISTNSVATAKRRNFYIWNCRTQKGTSRLRLDQDGKLTVPNLVEFHVDTFGAFGTPDPTATLLMKAKVLKALKFRGVNDLITVSHRAFGKHKIKVDASGFDWLKPIASYRLWLQINFHFFKFTNAKQRMHFFIGLPHSADLAVEIIEFCQPDQLESSLENGKSVEPIDLGVFENGKPGSKELRRRYLREKIRQLNAALLTEMLHQELLRRERDRYQRELEALE
ncbi:hypothetical protein SAMN05444003_2579 [Cognatiyoonia sediminum]|uniref:Uncharacterized protein n=1 Tax=Cognatiyoonia sediminum TaxID=1508389 RepID=A0A1M5RGR5_9RHOB|nr:hypothetical protein [Cognatiyoonia sediminum]SHH25431.1 hypothetical protein SAMN05444003_2579 [Cognatiyoonia sediminum]